MNSDTNDSPTASPQTDSLRHFLCGLNPDWCPAAPNPDAGQQLLHWFQWPPNTFLMTSRLLEDTGIYRFPVVQTGVEAWPPRGWPRVTRQRGDDWFVWISGPQGVAPPEWIKRCIAIIQDCLDLPMADLFDWQTPPGPAREDEPRKRRVLALCRALVELHAVADHASAGFGLPSGHVHAEEPALAMVTYLANSLLISTGSLATLSRFHGVVLPKMRTPQVGMTLRSLSLQLTYHRTDVEVVWRSLPWVNQDENTINLLVVPFPYEIRPDAFRATPHPNFAESIGKVRYFKYSPPSERNAERESIFDPQSVLTYIKEAEKFVRKVNLLVFPEVALTQAQLHEVQTLLAARGDPQAPLIIAGVGGEGVRDTGQHPLATNEVVLSTYFAGKWYDIRQAKHHRWRVDGKQIEQYQIAGALAGTQVWWEAIDLPKRQVCCLAPNQWLALCPLICEDLARQEPVYDVIRGVGPTLLTTILLDGPQLKARWSARYASVLADDPGTSVLTTTSYGMAKRSVPPQSDKAPNEDEACKIALWKDQKNGYREIGISKDDGAVVMTLSAEFLTEYTADARDDHGSASSFVLHSHQTLRRPPSSKASVTSKRTPTSKPGDTLDMVELSIFTHLVDSALDHAQHWVREMCELALGERSGSSVVPKMREVIEITKRARVRLASGRADGHVRDDMRYAVGCFERTMEEINTVAPAGPEPAAGRRRAALIAAATKMLATAERSRQAPRKLDAEEVIRVHQMVGRSILWAIHMRLDWSRRWGTLTQDESQHLDAIERLLADPRRTRPEVGKGKAK